MQFKPSLILSAILALASAPLLVHAQQSELLSCVFGAVLNGDIALDGDMSEVITAVTTLCCAEGNDDPTCTALGCLDFATNSMKEPCTCGEATQAQAAMKEDAMLSAQIASMMPTAFSASDAIFAACCASDNTTATEVNACLATLPVMTTTTAATEAIVEAATEPAATEPAVTEPAATEPAITEPAATEPATMESPETETSANPATDSSSGSTASIPLPFIVAYGLYNLLM